MNKFLQQLRMYLSEHPQDRNEILEGIERSAEHARLCGDRPHYQSLLTLVERISEDKEATV